MSLDRHESRRRRSQEPRSDFGLSSLSGLVRMLRRREDGVFEEYRPPEHITEGPIRLLISSIQSDFACAHFVSCQFCNNRSEEHTSELQSLMRISYTVLCFKK